MYRFSNIQMNINFHHVVIYRMLCIEAWRIVLISTIVFDGSSLHCGRILLHCYIVMVWVI